MTIKTLDSSLIYSGRVFNLRSDRIELPNGNITSLDILDHRGAVVIVPLDEDGRLLMVRQYRHASASFLLEFPAGSLEHGEEPLTCAQRELREETGFAARTLEKIGGFFLAPGYSTEYLQVYLAAGLEEAPLPPDSDEWLEVERYPIDELFALAGSGELEDAKSLAALFLARSRLG